MALTNAQLHQHIGQMLDDATATNAVRQNFPDEALRLFVKAAKFYRVNGSVGTLTDRSEAMRTFIRALFTRVTGRDPDAITTHFFAHWIDEVEAGEVSNYT